VKKTAAIEDVHFSLITISSNFSVILHDTKRKEYKSPKINSTILVLYYYTAIHDGDYITLNIFDGRIFKNYLTIKLGMQ